MPEETSLGDLGTVGYWVGSTIGAVFGLVLLVLVAWLCCRPPSCRGG